MNSIAPELKIIAKIGFAIIFAWIFISLVKISIFFALIILFLAFVPVKMSLFGVKSNETIFSFLKTKFFEVKKAVLK